MSFPLYRLASVLVSCSAIAASSAFASTASSPKGFLCSDAQAFKTSLYVFHHGATTDLGSATIVTLGKMGFESGFAPFSVEKLANSDDAYVYKVAPGVAAPFEQLSIQVPAPKPTTRPRPCGRGACDLTNFPAPAQATLVQEGIASTLVCEAL